MLGWGMVASGKGCLRKPQDTAECMPSAGGTGRCTLAGAGRVARSMAGRETDGYWERGQITQVLAADFGFYSTECSNKWTKMRLGCTVAPCSKLVVPLSVLFLLPFPLRRSTVLTRFPMGACS